MSEKLNRFIIQCIMLAAPLFRVMHINTEQLKVILQTKCMLDDRRSKGGIYRKSSRNLSWFKNFFYLILGIFVGSIFFSVNSFLAQTLYLTIFMIYAVGILITDFSNVLIDVRDHYFIVSRPVSETTVSAARIFHILIYLGKYLFPFFCPVFLSYFLKTGCSRDFYSCLKSHRQ